MAEQQLHVIYLAEPLTSALCVRTAALAGGVACLAGLHGLPSALVHHSCMHLSRCLGAGGNALADVCMLCCAVQVETLARKVLVDPVEIQVGGRSVVNRDITQYVEIRPEEERFLRLLEVLGEW